MKQNGKEIEEPPGEEWNVIEDTDNFLSNKFYWNYQ